MPAAGAIAAKEQEYRPVARADAANTPRGQVGVEPLLEIAGHQHQNLAHFVAQLSTASHCNCETIS